LGPAKKGKKGKKELGGGEKTRHLEVVNKGMEEGRVYSLGGILGNGKGGPLLKVAKKLGKGALEALTCILHPFWERGDAKEKKKREEISETPIGETLWGAFPGGTR